MHQPSDCSPTQSILNGSPVMRTAPDFDAVRDKRISELTPEQQGDAMELWLRNNLQWMPKYHRDFYEFLLKRLDDTRA